MPKRKCYSIEEKLHIIKRIRNGETQATISKDTGIAGSTLRGWLKDEENIKSFIVTVNSNEGMKRKRVKLGRDQELDQELFNWFCKSRELDIPISGTILLHQAKKINKDLHKEERGEDADYSLTRGWLQRWQDRHGVHMNQQHGEAKSADLESAKNYLSVFNELIEDNNFTEDQVFNADETGLYYKTPPDRTMDLDDNPSRKTGHKKPKDKVSLLLCANRSGSLKMTPLVIGKSLNPRCLHHVNRSLLPCIYTNTRKAWMTGACFKDWFFQRFCPAVRKHLRKLGQEEKAILLIDNAPSHPSGDILKSKDGKIFASFMPKNTTSKIQPLDQGVINCFKLFYKDQLCEAMAREQKEMTVFLKAMDVKKTMEFAGPAWEKVTKDTIINCWRKGLGPPKSSEEEEPTASTSSTAPQSDNEEDFNGFSKEEVGRSAITALNLAPGTSALDALQAWVDQEERDLAEELLREEQLSTGEEEEPLEESEEEEAPVEPLPQPLHSKAEQSFLYGLRWLESLDEQECPNLRLKIHQVKILLDDTRRLSRASMKPTKITDFFKK